MPAAERLSWLLLQLVSPAREAWPPKPLLSTEPTRIPAALDAIMDLSGQTQQGADVQWACGTLVSLQQDGSVVTGFSLLNQQQPCLSLAGFQAKVG